MAKLMSNEMTRPLNPEMIAKSTPAILKTPEKWAYNLLNSK
jgi:hypothetical protein